MEENSDGTPLSFDVARSYGQDENRLRDFKRPQKKISRPIASYGIILFCIDAVDGRPRYLIYQRRDNYEYIDIIRGNWNNERRLKELFAALSAEEKDRLSRFSFRELWDDLWVTHGSNMHLEGFEKARKRFESFSNDIPTIVEGLPSSQAGENTNEPQWGFPKGKKNVYTQSGRKETDQECALREFGEETRLSTDGIVLWGSGDTGIGNVASSRTHGDAASPRTYTEFYKGNNGKPYCTYYFLAEISKMEKITRMKTPGCIRSDAVSDEAANAKWMTFEEALGKLVPRRQNILRKVNHLIETSYENYSPFCAKDTSHQR